MKNWQHKIVVHIYININEENITGCRESQESAWKGRVGQEQGRTEPTQNGGSRQLASEYYEASICLRRCSIDPESGSLVPPPSPSF